MSTWVSAAPVIGASSLDGFAIGALMTGACALAVTAPRRARGRKTPPARDRTLAAEEAGWLCEHVMAAEAAGSVQTADLTLTAAAAAPVPGDEPEASAERLAPFQESGARRRGPAKAAGGYRSRHRLGTPLAAAMPGNGPELVFPGPQPSDRTLGSPRRTQARRMPRHAAPPAGFGGRVTGLSSRMTGLFVPRALATGARG